MSSGKEMWSLKMFGAFVAQLLEPRSTIVAGAHESQQRSADRVPLATFRLFIPPLFLLFLMAMRRSESSGWLTRGCDTPRLCSIPSSNGCKCSQV